MQTLDIRQIDDEIVLYFCCEGSRINAYTLASALVSFADAAIYEFTKPDRGRAERVASGGRRAEAPASRNRRRAGCLAPPAILDHAFKGEL